MNNKVKSAIFDITDKLQIRYKKGFGYYIYKEINNHPYSCTKTFRCNPYAIGFKEQYGFGWEDIKSELFTSFEEALKYSKKVDTLPYIEYNPNTHEKFYDTILRKGRLEDIISNLLIEIRDGEIHK